jgi:hypothetical protein
MISREMMRRLIPSSTTASAELTRLMSISRHRRWDSDASAPEFANLMKSFYKKSHPDILRSYNIQKADENDTAFQQLNELLSTIKENNSYPPQQNRTLIFNVKENNTFKKVPLVIKTSGGECRKALYDSFSRFFLAAGVHSGKFVWGKDYFHSASPTFENEN